MLASDEGEGQRLCNDLSSMGTAALVYPARDFNFRAAEGQSREYEHQRLQVMAGMLDGDYQVVISCIDAALQYTIPPDELRSKRLTLRAGQEAPLEKIEALLSASGYERYQQVEGPGQFAVRGGILDFFTPDASAPVRVEFWGDEIDSISSFDTASQRRTESLERCSVLPAAETLPSLCRGGSAQLAAELNKLAARAERRGDARLAGTLAEDAERLENGAELRAADRYAGLVCSRRACALDYAPEGALVVLDQPGRFMDRAREYAKQLESDVEQLRSAGRMAAKAADFCLGEQEALDALARFPLYMADAFTAGRYPLPTASVRCV